MKESVDKLDIYNNSAIVLNRKTPKRIVSWITILVVLSLLTIAFSFIPFNVYKTFMGYISLKEENSYIILTLKYGDFPISTDKKLYVKGKQYNYEIENLEDNLLVLKIDLDEHLKIQNNLITVNFLEERTTLFKIIKKKLKKGLDL